NRQLPIILRSRTSLPTASSSSCAVSPMPQELSNRLLLPIGELAGVKESPMADRAGLEPEGRLTLVHHRDHQRPIPGAVHFPLRVVERRLPGRAGVDRLGPG